MIYIMQSFETVLFIAHAHIRCQYIPHYTILVEKIPWQVYR